MKKYRGKYRIESLRYKEWNYAAAALYYITICTKDRVQYFGEVSDGKMHLSQIGQLVEKEWLRTFELRPDMNLTQGAYVVMPDHFHAIIGIGKNQYNSFVGSADDENLSGMDPSLVSSKAIFGPQSRNLGAIVRGFKASVTMAARSIHPEFHWQSGYYDRIIRDDFECEMIIDYIINNPSSWGKK